jgi:hypothetical protein
MKLRAPTPDIDKNKPFDGALFGREEFAGLLRWFDWKTLSAMI